MSGIVALSESIGADGVDFKRANVDYPVGQTVADNRLLHFLFCTQEESRGWTGNRLLHFCQMMDETQTQPRRM